MAEPHDRFEGTPLWDAVSRALLDLEENADLTLRTARPYVVGVLCERVAETGLLRDAAMRPGAGTRAGFAAFLERVAGGGVEPDEWREHVATRYADGAVEEARRQAALLQLRLGQGSVSAEQAAEYFRALAGGLRKPAT
jgi:hypothetical protein